MLDVDCKNGATGLKTLSDLQVDVLTLTANTPSGGLHLYFKHPGKPLKARLDGIDIKGADGGGYVLGRARALQLGRRGDSGRTDARLSSQATDRNAATREMVSRCGKHG